MSASSDLNFRFLQFPYQTSCLVAFISIQLGILMDFFFVIVESLYCNPYHFTIITAITFHVIISSSYIYIDIVYEIKC